MVLATVVDPAEDLEQVRRLDVTVRKMRRPILLREHLAADQTLPVWKQGRIHVCRLNCPHAHVELDATKDRSGDGNIAHESVLR